MTPPLSVQPPPEIVTSYADPGKQALLNEQLDQLVAKQAIREIPHTDHVHFSRVFLVPKKNGKMRMVADLSRLNQWLQCPSFKMDNAQVVRDALLPDLWATSIDLTDAYLHIPIHPSCQKFLVFQVGNRRFMWLVLPFGLNTAPRVFSDVMKVLKQWGRTVGILLFQYLDDWLQLNMNAKILAQQTQQLIQQCMALGLLINHEKSDIVPMQRIVFLGDMLDFEQGFIFPTQARFEAIKDKIFRLTRHHDARFHVVRSLVGLLTATEKIVPFGRLHFRELQHFCNQQLAKGSVSSTRVVLPLSVLKDLDWWSTDSKVFNGLLMCQLIPDLQIQTDASTTGWGISFKGQVWSGTWTPEQQLQHINVLEMQTVLIACQTLLNQLRNKCVLFLVDNQTVVSYLQKQGGTRSQLLMSLTRQVLGLAESESFIIQARRIKGALNVVADLASRRGYVVNTEWMLAPAMFQWVQRQSPWGPALIDLFANSMNHQLPLYFSPCPDDQAMATDALLAPWPKSTTIYAFPPTTIMNKVLLKVAKEKPSQLLLIAPDIIEAQWFPLLQQMPHTKRLTLPVLFGDLRQPHWDHWHPDPTLFKLTLWCINFPNSEP